MKTIKQLADEIGVSKQAVYKRIKKEPLSTSLHGLLSTVDSRLTVSVDGEILIKQAFQEIAVNQSCQLVDGLVVESTTTVDRLVDSEITVLLKKNIEILQTQLETKDNQIESLSKQLQELTSALVLAQQNAIAAQALHAGTMKHIASDKENKPSIISRLFKRNKGM